jgi:hypothetical protein
VDLKQLEVIVEPYTGPVYERRGDRIIVIGAGPMMGQQVALLRKELEKANDSFFVPRRLRLQVQGR